MKRMIIMLLAVLSFGIAANACDAVVAFYEATDSEQFIVDSEYVYIGSCNSKNIVATYKANPYRNESMCSPGRKWATCYEYCFSYNGKTYFFNLK